jgi:hypothetical protein
VSGRSSVQRQKRPPRQRRPEAERAVGWSFLLEVRVEAEQQRRGATRLGLQLEWHFRMPTAAPSPRCGVAPLGPREIEQLMTLKLPSRYEDLDPAFRGRLRPDRDLLELVKSAYSMMRISGGIRFLPLYGESGSGKSCAAWELSSHLPDCEVFELKRDALASRDILESELRRQKLLTNGRKLLVGVVDQYEEQVADRHAIPTQFVESLSLLDRGPLRGFPVLVVWLTTSRTFQTQLADATSRNKRILVSGNYELSGPVRQEWPSIIEETFRFHNADTPLADLDIIQADLELAARVGDTLGDAIEATALRLTSHNNQLQDVSEYMVAMLWPVTNGQRIAQVAAFTDARAGYKLNWDAFFREISVTDRDRLPLQAYNRARLYFDLRLIPIAAADLMPLCRDLDTADDDVVLHRGYLDRFAKTHLYSVLTDSWSAENYSPLRERESKRANEAREWYSGVTTSSTQIGRRLALVLRSLGVNAAYEVEVKTKHSTVRADVLVQRPECERKQVIVELKAYSPENTIPSSIRDQIRVTLRRHAQLAGFLPTQ